MQETKGVLLHNGFVAGLFIDDIGPSQMLYQQRYVFSLYVYYNIDILGSSR